MSNMIKKKKIENHSYVISLVGWLLGLITHEDKDLLGRVREAYLRVVLQGPDFVFPNFVTVNPSP